MIRPARPSLSNLLVAAATAAAQSAAWLPNVLWAEPLSVRSERPLRDPYVPPEARKAGTAPAAQGAALRAQVLRKLQKAFDDADVGHTGWLTRQQANAAGPGLVARHFDQIAPPAAGAVRFA